MSQKKYVVYVSCSYVAKNQLHKDVHAFFKSINHNIYSDIEALKKKIRLGVEHLNTNNKRCKPVNLNFWKSNPKTIVIGALPQISVSILISEEAFNG